METMPEELITSKIMLLTIDKIASVLNGSQDENKIKQGIKQRQLKQLSRG
jgi:hypothetical protein